MAEGMAALQEKHLGLPTWGWLTVGGALVLFVLYRSRQAATGTTATQGAQVPGQPLNFLVEPPSGGGGGGSGGPIAAPPPLPPLAPPTPPSVPAFTDSIWGPLAAGAHYNAINDYLVPQAAYPNTLKPVGPEDIAAFKASNPGY